MPDGLMALADPYGAGAALAGVLDVLASLKHYFLIFLGLSLVIFFHELGHFIAAKACGVRVHKLAVGFGRELFGFTRGETRYAFNALPLGGYVKMLGQEDFDDKSAEWAVKDDPRAFTNKPVGQRMIIVSAGVIMNLAFAAVVFMITFMIGLQAIPAEVGWIKPGSPAEQIGLRLGDRIRMINGKPVADQSDLKAAVVLADPDSPLRITYERTDPATGQVRTGDVTVRPERDEEQNILQLGVAPPLGTTVAGIIPEPALPADQQLREGDEVLEVNGRKVDSFFEMNFILADLRGQFADILVRRPVPDATGGPVRTEDRNVQWRARMNFLPEGRPGQASGHLLGLVPRVRLAEINEGGRAAQAGLRDGDVVVRWGNQVAPRIDEITASIDQNPETPMAVTVLRYANGQTRTLTCEVRPRVPGLFFKRRPTIDLGPRGLQGQESDQIIVADVLDTRPGGRKTAAAALKGVVPRGARITRLNGEPVRAWHELAERLITLAGTTVTLSWTAEGLPETSARMEIPPTLGTTFPLPAARVITAIDGRARTEVEVNGRRIAMPVDQWQAAAAVLQQCVGRTVDVEFWDQAARRFHKQPLAVTAEMVDPWVMRVQYDVTDVMTNLKRVLVRETNPARAMMIGLRKTYYFIVQVCMTMQRMIITRSMGLEQISGPVGILKMGSDLAAAGLPVLLYFLALISANFAVINFLPLPIFDGGLFVFLIIEKIKGRPVSLKVQIATQIVGLALIVGIFLFVTFQDIAKLLGWA